MRLFLTATAAVGAGVLIGWVCREHIDGAVAALAYTLADHGFRVHE